jgi:hypothetical protein
MPTHENATGAADLLTTPLQQLGLKIEGNRLEPVIAEFRRELELVGVRRLRPHFYLSTEWGVPWGSVSIAIPFSLAPDDLTALHTERHGHVAGTSTYTSPVSVSRRSIRT